MNSADACDLHPAIETAFAIKPNDDTTFQIVREFVSGDRALLVAASPLGRAALIVPGAYAPTPPGFATKRLVAHTSASLTLTLGGSTRSTPAAIIECTDHAMIEPFAALANHLCATLARAPLSWAEIYALIRRWSTLFSEGRALDEQEAVGLWGELWVLAHSSELARLIEGWRGPYAGTADFILDVGRLEVKTTARPFVHHLSQAQTQLADGAFFLSLAIDEGAGGETLESLANRVLAKAPHAALFFEGLVRIGCSLDTLAVSKRQRVLLAEPTIFRVADLPQVRKVDAGISDLRFTVTLDPQSALNGPALEEAKAAFGLQFPS